MLDIDRIIADDGFAGAGGWSLACAALGIVERGIENMPAARATRDAAGMTTSHDDVWTHRPDGCAYLRIDSPPCQTFSAAGKGTGRKALDQVLAAVRLGAWRTMEGLQQLGRDAGDDRTGLVLTPLHYALGGYGYRALAWEQVPTVLPAWEACAEVLREHGWNVWTGLLHSEQYGVPQTRKRAVLIASLDRVVGRPKPTHSRYYSRTPTKLDPGVQKWVSMAEALGWSDGALVTSNYNRGGIKDNRGTRSADHPAFTVTSKSDRDRIAWPFHRPSPTVVGSRRSAGGMLIGRQLGDDSRADVGGHQTSKGLRKGQLAGMRVTVHEAGVLQSFPADYPWQGAKGKQFLQAGNAVPPLMGVHILKEVLGL